MLFFGASSSKRAYEDPLKAIRRDILLATRLLNHYQELLDKCYKMSGEAEINEATIADIKILVSKLYLLVHGVPPQETLPLPKDDEFGCSIVGSSKYGKERFNPSRRPINPVASLLKDFQYEKEFIELQRLINEKKSGSSHVDLVLKEQAALVRELINKNPAYLNVCSDEMKSVLGFSRKEFDLSNAHGAAHKK